MTKTDIGGDNVREIKDLYNHALSYSEGFGYPHYGDWTRVHTELQEVIQELTVELTDRQKQRLQEIEQLHIRASSLELERMFVYGFKCGARLIMDVSTE